MRKPYFLCPCNTPQLGLIIQRRAEGYPVEDEDLVHLSLARFEHINRLGKYTFAEQEILLRNGLRPLRQPEQAL